MANVKSTFDSLADAAYIYLVEEIALGSVVKNAPIDPEHGMIVLDFDKDGVLLGVEVLDATRLLSPELLAQADRI